MPGRDEKKWALCASSIPEGRVSEQRPSLVLLATEEWSQSPRSSTGQFVAHLENSLWIERCASQVVGENLKALVQIGFKKQRMCLGSFTLHSPAGISSGVICLHVDDMLGTGDGLFELKLKELDKLVGFGSRQR